jgi:hypothetical protein
MRASPAGGLAQKITVERIIAILEECLLPSIATLRQVIRIGIRSADFIRASSHAVLREQAEHMDAPIGANCCTKSSCATGAIHT